MSFDLLAYSLFSAEAWTEAWDIFLTEFPLALWETLYVTVLSTLFAFLIGLPLGVLLACGDKNGILPLPRWLKVLLGFLVNVLRSVPFIILMIIVLPLSRVIVGTTVGTIAMIVPLVAAAFPFVARIVESSIREVSPNLVEAAESMGATPLQIVFKVLLPESFPSLISNLTLTLTNVLGYSAMSGTIGGGGLGDIAYKYGYLRYRTAVLLLAVLLLIVLVQIIQCVGSYLSVRADKSLKPALKKRKRKNALPLSS